ncbi:HAF repeat-containing protein [Acetivibrio cellulolyticus]|uniref:HAF repeat-containing protein n=1 Tax=Acetivibrio cellulolyticus TaxID=35830 RepID=UPI0001E2C6C2|nr:HAF repeat-containing protein [Acetivibrio cellulolyticus]
MISKKNKNVNTSIRLLTKLMLIFTAIILFQLAAMSVYAESEMKYLGTIDKDKTTIYSANSKGQVVGSYITNGTEVRAFLWEKGVFKDLGTLGGTYTKAYAMNDKDQVVGVSKTKENKYHAFLWENGVMKDMGTLGGNDVEPTAINNKGQVVGVSETKENEYHAFLWEKGVMKDLGTLGGNYTKATAINDKGQVIGYLFTKDAKERHAFLWENGAMKDLGTLGSCSLGTDINEKGQIVGFSDTKKDNKWHIILWEDGVTKDLITLENSTSHSGINYIYDDNIYVRINENGMVLAYESWRETVLWKEGAVKKIDFGVITSAFDVNPYDVNDDGGIIGVLEGKNASTSAFIWKDTKPFTVQTMIPTNQDIGKTERELTVKVNGSEVVFPDAKPYIDKSSNRTLIPIRFVSEKLGAQVTWDGSLKVIGIKKEDIDIKMKIGDSFAVVNGEEIQLDVPAVITSGRTSVPLRFISEVLEAKVEWEPENMTVSILAMVTKFDEKLLTELKSIYNSYMESYKTGDIESAKGYVSERYYAIVKNYLLATGETKMPENQLLSDIKDIEGAIRCGVFENGPTIGIVYKKPSKAEDKITFVFLRFVKEDSGWKYDYTLVEDRYGYNETDKFTAKDITGDMLDGKVITDVPAINNVEIPKSYLSIGFHNSCFVSVSINNEEPVIGAYLGLIMDGLKKGENTVDILIIPDDKDNNPSLPEIEIYYLDESNAKKVVYSNKGVEKTGNTSQTFIVKP